jgi:hypothetical protein
VTVFAAVATTPPPPEECGCIHGERETRYEWYDFEEAISALSSQVDRRCILSITSAVAEAVSAGVVVLEIPGAFRPRVAALDNELSLNQLLALMPVAESPSKAIAAHAEHTEHVALAAPGGRAVPTSLASNATTVSTWTFCAPVEKTKRSQYSSSVEWKCGKKGGCGCGKKGRKGCC